MWSIVNTYEQVFREHFMKILLFQPKLERKLISYCPHKVMTLCEMSGNKIDVVGSYGNANSNAKIFNKIGI